MKLGILTNVVCNLSLEEALEYLKNLGIEMVEIGCGGTPGIHHCDPEKLLTDDEAFERFKHTVRQSGLGISAFSCHGNPLHPVKEIGERYDRIMRSAVLMAERMGVDTICCFSGCPGSSENERYPQWCTTVWPFDPVAANHWQWKEVIIPYWKEFAAFAREHHVHHIAIEMHPGFCVYNPMTLKRLREACGEEIGANFDPSHLIWQGIDIPTAVRSLEGCIYHFHAKDTYVDALEMGKNGFFDPMGTYEDKYRPFSFRIPGNGTGQDYWRKIMTALSQAGYDGTISIEHEDNTMGQEEGIRKSIEFLKTILVREPPSDCWWKASIKEYQATFLPGRREKG